MLALMISTCILPHTEAISNLHVQTPHTVHESPHLKMSTIVEMAWAFSTVLGILKEEAGNEVVLFLIIVIYEYLNCTIEIYTLLSWPVSCLVSSVMIPPPPYWLHLPGNFLMSGMEIFEGLFRNVLLCVQLYSVRPVFMFSVCV